jgi:hypothetical protein
MAPRSDAPERSVNLAAMRELANFSAQAAISKHARKQLISATRVKLMVAVVALAAGGGLLSFYFSGTTTPWILYAGVAAFLIGLFWAVQYAILTGRLVVSRSGHLETRAHAAPDEADIADDLSPSPPEATDDDASQNSSEHDATTRSGSQAEGPASDPNAEDSQDDPAPQATDEEISPITTEAQLSAILMGRDEAADSPADPHEESDKR